MSNIIKTITEGFHGMLPTESEWTRHQQQKRWKQDLSWRNNGRILRTNRHTRATTKRKMVKVRETHGELPKAAKKRPLLGFTENKKVNGVSNKELPLVIIVAIRDHDVARGLLYEGSSINILYQDAFEKLSLKRKDLKPYDGTDLHGFNEMSTRMWGYVTLNVTFGEEMDERTV